MTSGVIGATAGGLIGGLIGYGIPKEQATIYSDRIAGGGYFVILDGTEADVRQAEVILRRWQIEKLRVYDATPMTPTTTYPDRR